MPALLPGPSIMNIMPDVKHYNPEIHHRRSIRLRGYDYTQAGAYFLTICTQYRECLFGEVIEDKIVLNDAGRMIQSIWDELPGHYLGVDIDAYVTMPNHIHGIIVLTDDINGLEVHPPSGQARGPAPTLSLSDVVHRFKSLTTARYRHGVMEQNWLPFPGKLWHRNYYEHIIRNDDELNRVREYIAWNPARWIDDENNPDNARFQTHL